MHRDIKLKNVLVRKTFDLTNPEVLRGPLSGREERAINEVIALFIYHELKDFIVSNNWSCSRVL